MPDLPEPNVGYLIRADVILLDTFPASKVHGSNMGPTWGRQDPGRSRVGPMNLAIWVTLTLSIVK